MTTDISAENKASPTQVNRSLALFIWPIFLAVAMVTTRIITYSLSMFGSGSAMSEKLFWRVLAIWSAELMANLFIFIFAFTLLSAYYQRTRPTLRNGIIMIISYVIWFIWVNFFASLPLRLIVGYFNDHQLIWGVIRLIYKLAVEIVLIWGIFAITKPLIRVSKPPSQGCHEAKIYAHLLTLLILSFGFALQSVFIVTPESLQIIRKLGSQLTLALMLCFTFVSYLIFYQLARSAITTPFPTIPLGKLLGCVIWSYSKFVIIGVSLVCGLVLLVNSVNIANPRTADNVAGIVCVAVVVSIALALWSYRRSVKRFFGRSAHPAQTQ